jgi:hypothetical protein
VWDDSDNPDPMWKFRMVKQTGCVGEAFGELCP